MPVTCAVLMMGNQSARTGLLCSDLDGAPRSRPEESASTGLAPSSTGRFVSILRRSEEGGLHTHTTGTSGHLKELCQGYTILGISQRFCQK